MTINLIHPTGHNGTLHAMDIGGGSGIPSSRHAAKALIRHDVRHAQLEAAINAQQAIIDAYNPDQLNCP